MNNLFKSLIHWLKEHPVVRKPLNTFWQAFLSFFLLGLVNVYDSVLKVGIAGSKQAIIALLVGALAAAFSAVKTYIVESFKESQKLT